MKARWLIKGLPTHLATPTSLDLDYDNSQGPLSEMAKLVTSRVKKTHQCGIGGGGGGLIVAL